MRYAPAAGSRSGMFTQAGLLLLVLALMYLFFEFALPRTLPYPIHPDDYSNVSGGFADLSWRWKRPVWANLTFFVSEFGLVASYAFLNVLAVLDAALVLFFLGRMFAVRIGLMTTLVFGSIVFSHVSAFEHATYLGLLTNLISHGFGLVAMFALLQGWRAAHAPKLALAALAYLLSAFSKEDFLLPPLLLIAFLAIADRNQEDDPKYRSVSRRRWTRWLGALAIVAICVGSTLWNVHVRSPYVAGLFSPASSSVAYATQLTPRSLANGFWTLLGVYAPFASVAALLACAWLWVTAPRLRPHVVWYVATVAALVLPYAVIPHNMPTFRTYAWLPWLAGIVAIALQVAAQRTSGSPAAPRARFVIAIFGAAVALFAVWSHYPAHTAMATEYARTSQINRSMVQTLIAQRAEIAQAPVVGIVGLQGASPWCANDAWYPNGKLGFDNRWIIFVPQPSACYTQQVPDIKRKQGIHVAVAGLDTLCGYGALPVLEYAADGTGRLRRAADYCSGGVSR